MAAKEIVDNLLKQYLDTFNSGRFCWDEVKHLYSKNTKYMVPGMTIVQGSEDIKVLLEHYTSSLEAGSKMTVDLKDVYPAGDVIITQGNYTISTANGDVLEDNKFLTVYKQENESWVCLYDIMNSNK